MGGGSGGGRMLRTRELEATDILGFSPELLAEYNKARMEFDRFSKRHARRRRRLSQQPDAAHQTFARKLDDEHTLEIRVHYVL